MGTALNLQLVGGPLLGGLLADSLGLQGALAVNAVTFLGSAALLLRVPKLPIPDGGHGRDRFLADTRAKLSFVGSHATARASVFSFGAANSAYGIGMVLASILLIRAGGRRPDSVYFLAGWLLSGIGTLLTGLAPAVPIAIAMQAVAGAGNGAENIAADSLLQKTVPPKMLGRVFGLSATAAGLGGTMAYAIGGIILELTSARTVFVIAEARASPFSSWLSSCSGRHPDGCPSLPPDSRTASF